MKVKNSLLFLFAAALLAQAEPAETQNAGSAGPKAVSLSPDTITPFSINVKDFGAKGDGATDDTEAIQRAALAAYQPPAARAWMVTRYDQCMHDAPHPEIVFPEGVYILSGTVLFDWNTSIRGIGKAVVRQTDQSKDSFYFERALRVRVENMSFDGGLHQLRHWTEDCLLSTNKT